MDSSDSEDVEQSTPPPRVHVRPPHDEMDVTFTLSPPVYSGSFRGCNVPEFPQEHVPKISDTSKPICLVLGIRSPSAKVILSRLVSEGYLVRIVVQSEQWKDQLNLMGNIDAFYDPCFTQETVAIVGEDAEFCLHLAPTYSFWDPDKTILEASRQQTVAIINGCRASEISRLVVHVPSASLYTGGPLVDEAAGELCDLPGFPVGDAGEILNMVERLVLGSNGYYTPTGASEPVYFSTMIVRTHLLWGSCSDLSTTNFVVRCRDVVPWLIENGRWPVSTCHAGNLAEGIICALARGRGGHCYNITDGKPVRFADFLKGIVVANGELLPAHPLTTCGQKGETRFQLRLPLKQAKAIGKETEMKAGGGTRPIVTEAYAGMLGQAMTLCSHKSESHLGYKPRISYSQGFKRLKHERQTVVRSTGQGANNASTEASCQDTSG